MSYQLAKARCAERTRAELLEYAPRRPLSSRDETRIRWQQGRCGVCRACPSVIRALAIMLPAVEPVSAVVFRLAG